MHDYVQMDNKKTKSRKQNDESQALIIEISMNLLTCDIPPVQVTQ